jgi:hypothetical protein
MWPRESAELKNGGEMISDLHEAIDRVDAITSHLADRLDGVDVSKQVLTQFKAMSNNLGMARAAADDTSESAYADIAKRVFIHANALGTELVHGPSLSPDIVSIGKDLLKLAADGSKYIAGLTEKFEKGQLTSANATQAPTGSGSVRHDLRIVREQLAQQRTDFKAWVDEVDETRAAVQRSLQQLQAAVKDPVQRAQQEYEASRKELEQRRQEVNSLVGLVSQAAVSGSFEESAMSERKTANWLRTAAIVLMGCIVALVGYSFFEARTGTINWDAAAYRAGLAFILSIPSAYLARESAKHRQQQYSYQQTALDLKALDPYLASLPIEQQNKIKLDISYRIFSGKDFSHVTKDIYPINAQELLLELFKRVEIKPRNKGK